MLRQPPVDVQARAELAVAGLHEGGRRGPAATARGGALARWGQLGAGPA